MNKVQQPVEIVEGEFYTLRDGEKVGPMRHGPHGTWEGSTNVRDETRRWRADGRIMTHPKDIVAKWADVPATEADMAEGI